MSLVQVPSQGVMVHEQVLHRVHEHSKVSYCGLDYRDTMLYS